MRRRPKLTYDRGTLILHPPPQGKTWLDFVTWDDRIEKFRLSAQDYRPLVERLRNEGVDFIDAAQQFSPLDFDPAFPLEPYPHQREALLAWKKRRSPRSCGLTHRRRKNLPRPTGHGQYPPHNLGGGAYTRFDAPMVCPAQHRFSEH